MVCQGTYGESGHFWVRIGIAGQSWVVDPTVHQFEPGAPLLLMEQAAAQYKEASYLLFSQKRFSDLRQQVKGVGVNIRCPEPLIERLFCVLCAYV